MTVYGNNTDYIGATNTMAEWGDYLIPFMTKAPEYAYYVDQYNSLNGTKPVKLNQN